MSAKPDDLLLPLRRYTTLPAVLDLLKEKRLTLVSPSSWPDRNDSFYLEQYRQGRGAVGHPDWRGSNDGTVEIAGRCGCSPKRDGILLRLQRSAISLSGCRKHADVAVMTSE